MTNETYGYYPADIAGTIQHLSPLLKRQIRFAIDFIAEDPYCAKPLKEELAGLYSLRVNCYRIVYQISRKKILVQVIDIGPHGTIY